MVHILPAAPLGTTDQMSPDHAAVPNAYGVRDGLTDAEVPPVPSRKTPQPFGKDRLGIIVMTPDPARFPAPWPVAIFGPGATDPKWFVFQEADYNASLGIATVVTDPAGHGYGPNSTTTVISDGQPTTFLSYGRGRDLDGDGRIGLDGDGRINAGVKDGIGPTSHVQRDGRYLPSHKPLDLIRSGLIQTVVDEMALVRSIRAGMDIPGIGTNVIDPNRIMYYGQSLGGMYGTMLMGTDPLVRQGLLNVAGGPIVDAARMGVLRDFLGQTLRQFRPNPLNGGPGLNGFTEDLPLPGEPGRKATHPGSFQLQELFSFFDWFDRSGSPETFAPRIRLRPDRSWAASAKNVLFQVAYGDGTVPNPVSATLLRAGQLFDRTVYYRNDRSPSSSFNPHHILNDPSIAGWTATQQQLGIFLSTGQVVNTNPAWLEFPIADPHNLGCLHYADPQTGQVQGDPFNGEVPTRQPYPLSGHCASAG